MNADITPYQRALTQEEEALIATQPAWCRGLLKAWLQKGITWEEALAEMEEWSAVL